MPLRYLSGEEVKAGDVVLVAGERGRIEFVAEEDHAETGWFFKEFGPGCMILAPSFGRLFQAPNEDIDFVCRAALPSPEAG